MGVAIDASSAGITAASPTSPVTTTAFTVGTGLNRVLLVGIAFDQTAGTIGSLAMSWDSTGTPQSMFNINNSGITSDLGQAWLFGLRAPTSGNKTLSITFTGAPTSYCLGIASFTGADQAADLTTFKNAIGSVTASAGSPYTATINSPAGDMAIAYFGSLGVNFTVANTGTLFGEAATNISGAGIFLAGAGASTVLSIASGASTNPACQVGCDIAAVAAASPGGGVKSYSYARPVLRRPFRQGPLAGLKPVKAFPTSATTTWLDNGPETFAGAGNFIAAAEWVDVDTGPEIFAGVGALIANATHTPQDQGADTFAGVGAFLATAEWVDVDTGPETFAGAGAFLFDSIVENFATATFAGVGAFVGDAPALHIATATFAGTGALVANATHTPQGAATFAGAGAFSAFATWISVDAGPETFAGAGGLAAAATHTPQGSSAFAGSGAFAAAATWIDVDFGPETFAGTGLFVGNATVPGSGPTIWPGSATFAGSGAFSAFAYQLWASVATFFGTGAFSAFAYQNWANVVIFAGSGVEVANATHTPAGTSTFAGAGAFTVVAGEAEPAIASLAGAGAFTATAVQLWASRATFSGIGLVTVTSLQNWAATSVFVGFGSLFGVGSAPALPNQLYLTGAGSFTANAVNFVMPTTSRAPIIGQNQRSTITGRETSTTEIVGSMTQTEIEGEVV